MEPAAWITTLETGGPWAIVVALALAVVALARAYVQARDARDAALAAVTDKLTALLTDVIRSSEKQHASNERVADVLENLERRFEASVTVRGNHNG